MKLLTYTIEETALVHKKELDVLGDILISEIDRMSRVHDYHTPYASLFCPVDLSMHNQVDALVRKKNKLSPSALVVIGIGGSSLGTQAVYQACGKTKIPLYVADMVDSDVIYNLKEKIRALLQAQKTVIFNVVSKSGTTTETVANFQIFLNLLKEYHPHDYAQYIVVTTDKNSVLWEYAKKKGCDVLEIPQLVGGRYSVLSPVGLFPLSLLGIDVNALSRGAAAQRELCLSQSVYENPAALSASILFAHYKKNIRIHDLFLFSYRLYGLGNWYRQLMGESIGKQYTKNHKEVFVGITPTVSIGSLDLHSVAQLYLGGPYDRFTSFISLAHPDHDVIVPPSDLNAVADIDNQKLSTISDAMLYGTKEAYKKNKRPFMSLTMPHCDEVSIGAWLQLHMMQMMYLGFLLEVDPFDQPHVELYKKETRRILRNG